MNHITISHLLVCLSVFVNDLEFGLTSELLHFPQEFSIESDLFFGHVSVLLAGMGSSAAPRARGLQPAAEAALASQAGAGLGSLQSNGFTF